MKRLKPCLSLYDNDQWVYASIRTDIKMHSMNFVNRVRNGGGPWVVEQIVTPVADSHRMPRRSCETL